MENQNFAQALITELCSDHSLCFNNVPAQMITGNMGPTTLPAYYFVVIIFDI